jgi:hypothetical protein
VSGEKYISRNLEFQDHLVTESGGGRDQFRLNDIENEMNSEKFLFQSCIQEFYLPASVQFSGDFAFIPTQLRLFSAVIVHCNRPLHRVTEIVPQCGRQTAYHALPNLHHPFRCNSFSDVCPEYY